ncbi:hypothetical protein SEA_GOURDTHYMES_81 [Gordonia phage GourdThymes]|nr:hypothetical protein SEA_GOURDTHYMES_81 [Gordonia phage GourdThymes]
MAEDWDAEYRGVTKEEYQKLVDRPLGTRFPPELREIFDRVVANGAKTCICGHLKQDHSEDERVDHYCSQYFCNCREFLEQEEL